MAPRQENLIGLELEKDMDPAPNGGRRPESEERRRSPRGNLALPVFVRVGETVYEGTTENLSYAGVMVLSHGDLPEIGAPCEVLLRLPAGDVEGRGRVVRHEVEFNRFAVDLSHVDTHGDILLATLLMSGG